MEKIKLCIFDMDGLLVDTERGMWIKNEMKAIETMGFDPNYALVKSVMGTPYSEYKYTIANYYGDSFDPDKFESLLLDFNDKDLKSNNIKLMPGCKKLLEYLINKNIKMVVATSSLKDSATSLLSNLGIIDYFDDVISSKDIGKSKPHPDIFLSCLKDYKKEEAVVFEDSHNGASAAFNAGIKLILVPTVIDVSDEENKKAYKIIKCLDEAIDFID